jgi:outer membrane lipoprotein LolB
VKPARDRTWASTRRLLSGWLLIAAALLLQACASPPGQPTATTQPERWSGRLGLVVASEPPQSFFAGFELNGNPQAGELSLTSPLGSTLAVMQWQPGQTLLRQGEQTRRYESLEVLALELTGAAIPVRALFGWLNGTPQAVDGWEADLGSLDSGRLVARRLMPLPTAELRVVLEPRNGS